MPFGDFCSFGSWSPKDHALNKMLFDEAHKKGGGSGGGGGGNNSNPGCAVVFVIIIAVILALVFR